MMASRTLHTQASVTSRRSTSGNPESKWDQVLNSVKLGALRVVGLEPTAEEKRHWEALQGTILTREQAKGGPPIRSSLTPRDAAAVRHITGRSIHRVTPDGGGPSPVPSPVVTTPTDPRKMVYNKGTGRNVAIKTELKPDLWKVAYQGVRELASIRNRSPVPAVDRAPTAKSFFDLGDSDGEDFPDGHTPLTPTSTVLPPVEELDEDFFGTENSIERSGGFSRDEKSSPVEETDFAPLSSTLAIKADSPSQKPPHTHMRRDKILQRVREGLEEAQEGFQKVTLSGGYDRGFGGLGLTTYLLRFDYKGLNKKDRVLLDNQILHKRPYFSYWLMTVQVVIMIVALSVYGIAPYAWDLLNTRGTVLQPDGNFGVMSIQEVGNVWVGPRQRDLVVLGALYAPCMRWDFRLQNEIRNDREEERDLSGCCVRLDRGGCYQTLESDCSRRFNDWRNISEDGQTRAVCGTSPRTCTDPNLDFFPGIYLPGDLLTWLPVCRAATESSESHLQCEITARPCCHGIQAICNITTREVCDFLGGRFHQDSFLCSQVDCLNEICGLLPFREFNQPDQIYRLWLALFLHAGILHLLLSLLFDFFVLRHVEKRLGWWRTAIIYILSGVGGNMVSTFFVPYYPETGPAGSILGIVAYFFVFLIFESPHLRRPLIEALKLFFFVLLPLLLMGLLPFIDNFAHIGGLVFGFLLSGIFVPYWAEKKAWKEIKEPSPNAHKYNVLWKVKIAMIVVGLLLVPALFLLFILLFYYSQETISAFAYLNCVPFTTTFCIDNLPETRDRDVFVV